MPLGDNPNIFVTPNISPPFPVWEQTRNYWLGDVVNYAGQNWFLLFYADNGTQVGPGYAPDLYPITLNGTPESSPGIYVPVANPPDIPVNLNGGCWVNLTLATPPATPWSPTVQYNPGAVVMYPVESPGSYWRCIVASLGDDPKLITGTSPRLPDYNLALEQPPRIYPQFWEPLNGSSVPSQLPAAGLKAGDYAQPLAPLAFFGALNPDGTPVTLEFYWTTTSGFSYTSFELQLVNNTDPTDVYELVTLPGDTFSYEYTVPPEENFTATITPKLFLQTALPSTTSVTSGDTTINGPSNVSAVYNNEVLFVTVGWASVLGAVDYDIFWSSTNPVSSEQILAGNVLNSYSGWNDDTVIYAEVGLGANVTVSVAANFVSGPQSAKTAATPFTIIPVPAIFNVDPVPLHGATSFSGLLTFSQWSPTNGATFTAYFEVLDVTGGGSLVVGNTSASPFSVSNPSVNVPITEILTSPNTFLSGNIYNVVVYLTSSVTALASTYTTPPFTIAVIPS